MFVDIIQQIFYLSMVFGLNSVFTSHIGIKYSLIVGGGGNKSYVSVLTEAVKVMVQTRALNFASHDLSCPLPFLNIIRVKELFFTFGLSKLWILTGNFMKVF